MKRIIVKISIVLLLMLTMAGSKETEVSAKIKTKKITIDLRGGNTANFPIIGRTSDRHRL